MLNIAVIVYNFPPAPVGGAQQQARDWAHNLSAEHRVTLVDPCDPPGSPMHRQRDGRAVARQPFRVGGRVPIPRRLVPEILRGRGLSTPFRMLEERVRLFRDTTALARSIGATGAKPDVLLCFMTLPAGFAGVELGRRLGIPAVVWIRGENEYRLRPPGGRRRRSLRVWEGATAVLVQSETTGADFLAELEQVSPKAARMVRNKLAVVGNGVDLPEPTEVNLDGPVLSVGRLVPEKGMDVVIAACAQLGRPLIIAGRGPELPALRAQADELGADVRFVGFLDRANLGAHYRQASAVVLASHSEGLPNVVLEAMAHARPVVTTPVGGIPDLIEDGRNGLLIPVGDTAALVSALGSLSAEPAMAAALGSAARATAEQFAWSRVVPKLEEVLGRSRRP